LPKPYLYVDTIGLGDNRLIYTDKEIMNLLEIEVLKFSTSNNILQLSAIVITESLKSDAHSLLIILNQIKTILGYLPIGSIIVLGTKRNDTSAKQA
jgi:hypothetical protein